MVQTFLVEETKELIYDDEKLNEWKQKCEELGLTKQLDLANPERSPIPFEHMNEVARRVYETLCPTKVSYNEYSKTPIPLEVLGLIHLSKNEGYFARIEIWYDDKTPDPIAVGCTHKDYWAGDRYAIGRWGDVLRPFEELKGMAVKRFIDSTRINLQGKIAQAKGHLENIENNAARYFDGQVNSYEIGL